MSSGKYSSSDFSRSLAMKEETRQREERARQERERRAAELRRLEVERRRREREEAERREAERIAKELAARAEAQERVKLTHEAAQAGLELQRAQIKRDVAEVHKKIASANLAATQKQTLEKELAEFSRAAERGANLSAAQKRLIEMEAALVQQQSPPSVENTAALQAQWQAALIAFEKELIAEHTLLEKYGAKDLREIQTALQNRRQDQSEDYAYNLAALKGLRQRFKELCKNGREKAEVETRQQEAFGEELLQMLARANYLAESVGPPVLHERAMKVQQALAAASENVDAARLPHTLQEHRPQLEKLETSFAEWQRRESECTHLFQTMKETLEEMHYEVITTPEREGTIEAYIPGGEMVEINVGADGTVMSHVVHLVPKGPPPLLGHAEAVHYEQQRDKWCSDYDRIAERLAQQGIMLTTNERENKDIFQAEVRMSSRAQREQTKHFTEERKYLKEH